MGNLLLTTTGSILPGGLITTSNRPASHVDGQGEHFLCLSLSPLPITVPRSVDIQKMETVSKFDFETVSIFFAVSVVFVLFQK